MTDDNVNGAGTETLQVHVLPGYPDQAFTSMTSSAGNEVLVDRRVVPAIPKQYPDMIGTVMGVPVVVGRDGLVRTHPLWQSTSANKPVELADFSAAALIEALLRKMGEDTSAEGMRDTPRRFVEMLQEFYVWNGRDIAEVLKNGFESPTAEPQLVVQTDIPFRGLCEHHLAPMYGTAAIGYLPVRRILGLSKFARLVDAAGTRRPSTQEEITNTIAATLMRVADPLGVIVVTKAVHTCMAVRGVRSPHAETTCSVIKGVFRDNPAAKMEFLQLAGLGR